MDKPPRKTAASNLDGLHNSVCGNRNTSGNTFIHQSSKMEECMWIFLFILHFGIVRFKKNNPAEQHTHKDNIPQHVKHYVVT